MNAKQFQELLKQSKAIIKEEPTPDEDWKPKDAPELTKQRMSPEKEDSNSSIVSLLDEIIISAEEIVERAKECIQSVESGDSDYMKDIEDLESVIGGNTADLAAYMSEVTDAIHDAEEDDDEDDEDDDDER